jgi:cytochrome c-type biogenesis protein CcmH
VSGGRACAVALLCAGAALASCLGSAVAQAQEARVSLPTIERRVMCVTCKIPLNVAQSVQADRERAYIRGLIAAGDREGQIERELVGQYGPSVLALPRDTGFDLSAYLVPLAALLALAGTLALLLPSWRRRARAQARERAAASQEPPPLTPAQRARVEADLAQFER